jgi:hypothetical protein
MAFQNLSYQYYRVDLTINGMYPHGEEFSKHINNKFMSYLMILFLDVVIRQTITHLIYT